MKLETGPVARAGGAQRSFCSPLLSHPQPHAGGCQGPWASLQKWGGKKRIFSSVVPPSLLAHIFVPSGCTSLRAQHAAPRHCCLGRRFAPVFVFLGSMRGQLQDLGKGGKMRVPGPGSRALPEGPHSPWGPQDESLCPIPTGLQLRAGKDGAADGREVRATGNGGSGRVVRQVGGSCVGREAAGRGTSCSVGVGLLWRMESSGP